MDYEPVVPTEPRSNLKCYGWDVKRLYCWMMHCVDTFFFTVYYFYFVRTMAEWHPNRVCFSRRHFWVFTDVFLTFHQMLYSGFLFCIQFCCIYSSGEELWVGVVEGHLESCVTNIWKEYVKLDTEIRSNLELFHTVSYPYSVNT